ncbi:MAG: hypothetical protein IJJ52_05820 [Lachnospiraceae bacterium]|nr:hypothetical protein [Lachnospiraceae bacterium]
MNRKGSMTIYFSLVLAVMVPLICGAILSAKVSADRAFSANSMDLAMFSLFAHYDRDLAREYGLFFLDAAGSGGSVSPSACLREIEDAMDECLHPDRGSLLSGKNILDAVRKEGFIEGYSLATDAGGAPFEAEAIQAVKDTLGLEGIHLLKEHLDASHEAETEGKPLLEDAQTVSYGEVEAQAAEAASRETEVGEEDPEGGTVAEEVPEEEVPPDFVNPLPVLETLKNASVLDLVLPSGRTISEKAADPSGLVSGRSLASGIGVIDTEGATGGESLYFKGWILAHFQDFTDPNEDCGLSYPLEYLLAGKSSDRENLRSAVRKLLLAREAANILCLYTDAGMSLQLTEMAGMIAVFLAIPEAEPLIKALLAAGWAYAESLVDVRGLLMGKKVLAVKQAAYWQTDLTSLAESGGDLDGLAMDMPGGLTYREYLGAMLLAASGKKLVMRSMDMVESHIRGLGKAGFRLDACIVSLSAEVNVEAEGLVTFPVQMEYDYRKL